MANKTQTILIENILGGESTYANFSSSSQYRTAVGINPLLTAYDTVPTIPTGEYDGKPTGYLQPTGITTTSTGVLSSTYATKWIEETPKTSVMYLYNGHGSLYSLSISTFVPTQISDAGELSGSGGNGFAYYDNYIYMAKNTTIARYGPLNGTPSMNGDYWGTTLGKTELSNEQYPSDENGQTYPNHILHRHSDGNLYILDVINGEGVLHYISTKKTTVEGDTDNGSTYDKVGFGYGFLPTAIESYGNQLVVGLYEAPYETKKKAKFAIWDTTSQNIDTITTSEFPDKFIISIKNINGVLYFISSDSVNYQEDGGFRVSRYVGGSSIEEIGWFPGRPPYPGAIKSSDNKLFFGTHTNSPLNTDIVMMYDPISNSMHKPLCVTSPREITAIAELPNSKNGSNMLLAWSVISSALVTESGTDISNPTNATTSSYQSTPQCFWSNVYKIGRPFKVKKIRLPIVSSKEDGTTIQAGTNIVVSVWTDDKIKNTIETITSTKYSSSTRSIKIRPNGVTGEYNFWLEILWSGSEKCVIGLPILIEYEFLDD